MSDFYHIIEIHSVRKNKLHLKLLIIFLIKYINLMRYIDYL